MTLLDQEAARALVQCGDHPELRLGQLEAIHVVALACVRIRQQDERGSLLDQRRGDVALQRVLRALRSEDAQAILLTDGLLLVLGKFLQATFAIQDFPEFVHHVDQRTTVDQRLQAVQQVVDDRHAHFRVVDDVGVIKADDVGLAQVHGVDRVVEHPAQRIARRPAAHARVETIVAHVGQALLEVGHAAQVHRRVEHALHRAVDVLFLAGAVFTLAGQYLDQVGQELHVGFIVLALEWIEAGRRAVLQGQVVATAGAHEDLRTAVLVEEEDGRRRVVLLYLAEQEVDQRGLTGTRLTDHHGVGDGFLTQ